MTTLLLDPAAEDMLKAQRCRSGLDRFDEVWKGVLHMSPGPSGRHAKVQAQILERLGPLARGCGLTVGGPFNIGEGKEDFRVPDGGLHRTDEDILYYPTAALVVEIVSPGDETWEKLPFYAAHGVDELLIVDPQERAVHWRALRAGEYEPIEQSSLIELGPAELAKQIDWP